ncbi:MAG: hypothetical protein NC084_12570 [Bacteroides sp.]|nr:hypothetical protein [Eubacterium sp.]MCM1417713.1 hypothetical protein [Roseburia sp.]MCM1463527.1 hypothetical protein [Bacteroides sp.]
MNQLNVTSTDISLVSQKTQKRHVMVRLVNRAMQNVFTFRGRLISGSVNIDDSSAVRRTASVSMAIPDTDMDQLAHLSEGYYIRLYIGIEDNRSGNIAWYNQGTFIINQNGLSFDKTSRTLTLSLSDLMLDLTGERKGVLHAFSSVVKNSQRISDVMKNVLSVCGFENYDITPICVYRESNSFWDDQSTESDYMVPYDLEFSVGVTAYDILDKLVSLYPNWEIFFDTDGVFVCRRMETEKDSSFVVLDDQRMRELVISESTTVDFTKVKNVVEVWGKDGNYYGEARDENPESPFQPDAIGEIRMVVHYDQIYDRYKESELDKLQELNLDIAKKEGEIATLTKQLTEARQQLKIAEDPKAEKPEGLPSIATLKGTIAQCQTDIKSAQSGLPELRSQKNGLIDIKGDDMAKEWAEQLLYENCRRQDSITLQCLSLPFLNDINFKISYRSKADNKVKIYIVQSLSHDFAGNTTTIQAMRFYNDQVTSYQEQLDRPVIKAYSVVGREIVVEVEPVDHAESYVLYLDFKAIARGTGTTIGCTVPDYVVGEHIISITAEANGYSGSQYSETITVNIETEHS